VENDDFPDLVDSESERENEREPKQRWERVHRKKWKSLREEREVDVCPVEVGDAQIGMTFQVANVKKPLIAVKRICEKGNRVSFGPEAEDNFIQNRDNGNKIMMRKTDKGSYLVDVKFGNGMPCTPITVDSGAEENVCPWEWGKHFGIDEPKKWMNFASASGSRIEHYGTRNVNMTASTF